MKSSLLNPIFSALRRKTLAALLLQPKKRWYMLELARHLGVSRSSLQRELASLVDSEIVISHKDGNRVYFQANTQCPILPELQGILVKTVGVFDVLRQSLSEFGNKINVAFVYGSFAQAAEIASSDIDLFVVGRIGLADISAPLRSVEKELSRDVNPVVYSPDEVTRRLTEHDPFVSSVVSSKKLFLIGADSDLGKALSGRQNQD